MPDDIRLNERLIAPVLRIVDRTLESSPPPQHPDEETLADFAAGQSSESARTDVIAHLADCVDCRKAVSTMLEMAKEDVSLGARPTLLKLPSRRILWSAVAVAAASLLLATFLVFRPHGREIAAEKSVYDKTLALLEAGKFSEARSAVQAAAGQGVWSDRLRSLQSQAIRKFRGPIALAFAGRLTDFGFDLSGVIAREQGKGPTQSQAKEAEELLAAKPSQDVTLLLNHGHALLALDRPKEAVEVFRQAARSAPEQPLVWLGEGLASYMLEDYAGAERDFRECLRRDPNSVAAKINLAMTLEEEAKAAEALAVWKDLLKGQLPASDRQKIEQRANELERQGEP